MIAVFNFSRSRIDVKRVKACVKEIFIESGIFHLKQKRKVNPYLEVFFVGPKKMSQLHEKYLKKLGPTTVISLEALKDFSVGNFKSLGEIYLCPSEIKKSGFGLEYFLIHGFLHLCGYDHKTEKQARRMLAKEKDICAKIRMGD